MAFNKAKEEYKWKQWKAAEETKMRDLGVSEDVIFQLREQDWEDFKKERNYNEHQFPNSDVVEISMETMGNADVSYITTVKALLDEVESKELFELLCSVDKETLQIVLFRMLDIPTEQIAEKMSLTPNAIYLRINRLKEKIKKLSFRDLFMDLEEVTLAYSIPDSTLSQEITVSAFRATISSNITHFDECTIITRDSSTDHEFKAYLSPVETTN